MTGETVGRAPAIRDRGSSCDAGDIKPFDHVREHCRLAAMQMVGAGGVDNNTVRRIGGNDRRVAAQHPQRQPIERRDVGQGGGVLDHKIRN